MFDEAASHRSVRRLTALLVAAVSVTVVLPGFASEAKKRQYGTTAKKLEGMAPRYPVQHEREGREGWVQLSYVIGTDGSVADVVLEESSGVTAFERSAKLAVSQWRFEPATWNQNPVEQCHNRVFISFAMRGETGAQSSRFVRGHRSIQKLIAKSDLDAASDAIEALATRRGLNMYETSRLSLLRATIARQRSQPLEELEHLDRATMGPGIEPDLFRRVQFRRFQLQVGARFYAEALATLAQLEEEQPKEAVPREMTEVAAKIRALRESSGAVSVSGAISKPRSPEEALGVWHHSLLHREISFANLAGPLDHFELRCDWKRFSDRAALERTWKIPESWGDCRVFVFAPPGSSFDLIEHGPG